MIARTGILQLIAYSETRADILSLVSSAPQTFDNLKNGLKKGSPEISKQLKYLVDDHLIINNEGLCSITPMGKVISSYYKPLLDTIAAYEKSKEFWDTHNVNAIPDDLLLRMNELKECNLLTAKDFEIVESHPEFVSFVQDSTCFKGAACIFRASWIELFLALSNSGAPVEIIITQEIYDYIEKEYNAELQQGLKNPYAHIYVCDDLHISFAATNKFFSMSLDYTNGHHDTKNDLMGVDKSSIKWGESLFEHYKDNSVEVLPEFHSDEAITQKTLSELLAV